MAALIAALVDEAPALTQAQADKLAKLLRPVRVSYEHTKARSAA